MRLIPCNQTAECRAAGFALLRNGQPYVIGRAPSRWPFNVFCARCKRATLLDAQDYARRPEMRLADLQRLEIAHLATRDLIGAGVTQEQVEQLFAAGVLCSEVAA